MLFIDIRSIDRVGADRADTVHIQCELFISLKTYCIRSI